MNCDPLQHRPRRLADDRRPLLARRSGAENLGRRDRHLYRPRVADIAPGRQPAQAGVWKKGARRVLVLGAMKLAVIVAPLIFRLTPSELATLVRVIDPAVIALGSRYEPMLDALR